MFLARIAFFRLHESPRYLVHAGRPQEAVESLQLISRFNGSELSIDLEDVDDHRPAPGAKSLDENSVHTSLLPLEGDSAVHINKICESPTASVFNARESDADPPLPNTQTSSNLLRAGEPVVVKDYHSTGESSTPLESHALSISAEDLEISSHTYINVTPHTFASFPEVQPISSVHTFSQSPSHARRPRPRQSHSHQSRMSSTSMDSRRSSLGTKKRVGGALPRWIRRPLWAWLDRVAMVLAPEWRRTTLLVWGMWCSMSLGMFLPSFIICIHEMMNSLHNVQRLSPEITGDEFGQDPRRITMGRCDIYDWWLSRCHCESAIFFLHPTS